MDTARATHLVSLLLRQGRLLIMCGINGIYAFNNTAGIDSAPLVGGMNRSIAHRGPDDSGVWATSDSRLVLGHQRLSILDLSPNGHQPMSLADGTTIVFNGEIYNYRELRKLVPEFDFRSESDTETLLALYQKFGANCLEHLAGMFAFAIWDPKRSGVFLARDRIGNKPLYYTSQRGIFAFSSEIRSLLTLPWVERKIDEKALYYFLTFGFTPPPYTMFESIVKVEQGHSLWVDDQGPQTSQQYWSVGFQDMADDEAIVGQQLMSAIDRSVDLRMVSDVPVGLFLSGGVDSSALAALMRQRTQEPIHTFSISFADQPAYDEADAARAMAKRYGCKHHERVVTQDDVRRMIGSIVDVFDDPLADPTCIPIYFLSEMAKEQGIKVVLTGDGPDELLLGYRNWRRYQRLYPNYRRMLRLPKPLRSLALMLGRMVLRNPNVTEILHRASSGQELFWGNAPSFRESVKQGLLSNAFSERSKDWDCHDEIELLRRDYDASASRSSHSDSNWMAYLGLRLIIPNYYLHRADRLGMRHGIELRTPFLDHRIVNLCLSIPDCWKVKDGVPKYLMKKIFEPTLPKETLYATKKGFCVPLREWGGELMLEFVNDRLSSFCSETGLFDEQALRSAVQSKSSSDLWNLYFLINWFDRWILKPN